MLSTSHSGTSSGEILVFQVPRHRTPFKLLQTIPGIETIYKFLQFWHLIRYLRLMCIKIFSALVERNLGNVCLKFVTLLVQVIIWLITKLSICFSNKWSNMGAGVIPRTCCLWHRFWGDHCFQVLGRFDSWEDVQNIRIWVFWRL